MKTKTFFFSLFFVIVISFLNVNSVNSTSYYNWINNPSFSVYSNYCEDGDFESGSLESGILYGNWTSSSNFTFSTTVSLTGTSSARFQFQDGYYNFTNNVLGADIEEFTFWFYIPSSTYYLDVYIYYEDTSSDDDTYTLTPTLAWTQIDVIDLVNTAKIVDYIHFDYDGGVYLYIDDVRIEVDDGDGQDAITTDSTPWFLGGDVSGNFGHFNKVTGRLDNTSVQFSGTSLTNKLIQNIDYLDSDYVSYIDCYVLAADVSENEGVTCSVVYSDRTTDSKTEYVTGDGSNWENLNFGVSWIDSNKYIIQIRFSLASISGFNEFIIEDVGLWCSVPKGFTRFDFTVSPQPISITSFDFEAYSETAYTINCYFYNATSQELNENGTYSFSSAFGIETGNMVNGFFSISLSKRTYTGTSYTLESLSVTIITENEVFNVELSAYWYSVDGGGEVQDVTGDFLANWFLIAVFLIVIPISITGSITGIMAGSGHINPTMMLTAFLASETLMGAISLKIGVIDIWFMFAIIIVDVLIILGLLRGNSG